MFKDIVHSILKNYRETKRFFWEKPSKLKNLILLFSFAINDFFLRILKMLVYFNFLGRSVWMSKCQNTSREDIYFFFLRGRLCCIPTFKLCRKWLFKSSINEPIFVIYQQ